MHEYLRRAADSFDRVRKDYLDFHAGSALEPNLHNSAQELLPPALKAGLASLFRSRPERA